jgi:hypothetical protein
MRRLELTWGHECARTHLVRLHQMGGFSSHVEFKRVMVTDPIAQPIVPKMERHNETTAETF